MLPKIIICHNKVKIEKVSNHMCGKTNDGDRKTVFLGNFDLISSVMLPSNENVYVVALLVLFKLSFCYLCLLKFFLCNK